MRWITEFTREELKEILTCQGFPEFSASQIFNWIYRKRVEKFSLMTDLSRKLRAYLSEEFSFPELELKDRLISQDATEKFLFKLKDGVFIETVLIPQGRRKTLCLSTQAGCRLKCRFCVSGIPGFKRNLSVSEIVAQFLEVSHYIAPQRVTNIVFMGIGEPLDNFENVIKAVKIFMDSKGIYLGKTKICLSTCGLAPRIKRLAELNLGIKLSVSLHSADDAIRTKIMPVNKKYPLSELKEAIEAFVKREKSLITFEYVLIRDLNSSPKDALRLAGWVKGLPCKINLIPYNPSPYFPWQPPSQEEIEEFKKILKRCGVFFTLRKSRGQDIKASCGQLKAQFKS